MNQANRVLYNFDPCFLGTNPPKDGSYDEPITKEFVQKYVYELAGRGVDTFMCCPAMLRRKLWNSKYDPHWTDEARLVKEPANPSNWGWDDYLYFRMRNHIFGGGEPIRELYDAARKAGLSFFFTYRLNDMHYLEKEDSPIPDTFWKEHPEYRINDYGGTHPNMHPQLVNLLQNYMAPEVRAHYLNILTELVECYDVDGLELDFMRKPCLVPLPDLEEGREIVTGFVREVRKILDQFGKERGTQLQLCVRVPHTVQACYELAMDVSRWDQEGLIDMVNVSTSILTNLFGLDIEGYSQKMKHARIYGELHYSLSYAQKWPNHGRHFIRNTTKEQYETATFNLTQRGAYGVSLFNFVGCRQHNFNDPRGITYPGTEPPLDALDHLQDSDYLATCPKHYVVNEFIVDERAYKACPVPAKNDLIFDLPLFEKDIRKHYPEGALRVQTENSNRHLPIKVTINGVPLKEYVGTGELFTPVSIEGLPLIENVRYFRVPTGILVTGKNSVEVHNAQKACPKEFVTFNCIELALYTKEGASTR